MNKCDRRGCTNYRWRATIYSHHLMWFIWRSFGTCRQQIVAVYEVTNGTQWRWMTPLINLTCLKSGHESYYRLNVSGYRKVWIFCPKNIYSKYIHKRVKKVTKSVYCTNSFQRSLKNKKHFISFFHQGFSFREAINFYEFERNALYVSQFYFGEGVAHGCLHKCIILRWKSNTIELGLSVK